MTLTHPISGVNPRPAKAVSDTYIGERKRQSVSLPDIRITNAFGTGPAPRLHLLVRGGVTAEQPPVGLRQPGDRRDLLVSELEAEHAQVLALSLRVR